MASDQAKTIKDLVDAAQQGAARAQFELGRRHYHGDGAPKDTAAAIRWFRRAAQQEHLVARIYLEELLGEHEALAHIADRGFDRWLHSAVDGLRKSELRRRERRDLQVVLRSTKRHRLGRAAIPAVVVAGLALGAAILWWHGTAIY